MCLCVCACSVVSDSLWPHGPLWAHRTPLSMGSPRQEYWSGLPFPSPGDLTQLGIEPISPALAGRFFTPEPPGKPFTPLLSCKFLDCWKFDDFCPASGGETLKLAQGKYSKAIYERLDICHYYTKFTDKHWDSGKQMSL